MLFAVGRDKTFAIVGIYRIEIIIVVFIVIYVRGHNVSAGTLIYIGKKKNPSSMIIVYLSY